MNEVYLSTMLQTVTLGGRIHHLIVGGEKGIVPGGAK